MGNINTERPRVIDLFAGVGGLSLGFEQAGFDVIAAVEIDPIHCAAHKYNFPYSQILCTDIGKLDTVCFRKKLDIEINSIDVICGGPPCQGFSLIGKRVLDDPRNLLPKEFIRIVCELRPKFFVFENVPGLNTGKQVQILEEIKSDFEKSGYRITEPVRVLEATSFGVPQRRKRLFLLGSRSDMPEIDYPSAQFEAGPSGQLRLPGFDVCPTVAEALDGLPNVDSYSELLIDDTIKLKTRGISKYSKLMSEAEKDPFDFSYARNWDRTKLTSSLRTKHTQKSIHRFQETKCGTTEPISRFFKLDPQGYCNTLRSGTASDRGAFTSPRPIHYIYPRCITNREAARLHSYPDWFRFHKTKWHGFRQIGNSVPPRMARTIAAQIIKKMKIVPIKPAESISLGDERLLSFNMTEAAKYFSVDPNVIPKRKRGA